MRLDKGKKVYHIQWGEGEITRVEDKLIWVFFWRIPKYINDGVVPIEKRMVKDKVPTDWEFCGIGERTELTDTVFLEKFTLVFKTDG